MGGVTETLSGEAVEDGFASDGANGVSTAADLVDLLGEVEHDVGNLMHRMYYCCELLEQGAHADCSTTEATGELRESMGDLYRLISRTTDLMRPLQIRTFHVAVGEVYRRILQRLGCSARADEGVLGAFADCEVQVDPMPLDRALDMIAESLGCTDRQRGSAIEAEVEVRAGDSETEASLHLDLHQRDSSSKDLREWRPGGAAERICESLAERILKGFGWTLEASTNTPSPSCTIIIPLHSISD